MDPTQNGPHSRSQNILGGKPIVENPGQLQLNSKGNIVVGSRRNNTIVEIDYSDGGVTWSVLVGQAQKSSVLVDPSCICLSKFRDNLMWIADFGSFSVLEYDGSTTKTSNADNGNRIPDPHLSRIAGIGRMMDPESDNYVDIKPNASFVGNRATLCPLTAPYWVDANSDETLLAITNNDDTSQILILSIPDYIIKRFLVSLEKKWNNLNAVAFFDSNDSVYVSHESGVTLVDFSDNHPTQQNGYWKDVCGRQRICGYADGPAHEARFSGIRAMLMDPHKPIMYLADFSNNAVRAWNMESNWVTTVAKAHTTRDPLIQFMDDYRITGPFGGPIGLCWIGDGDLAVSCYADGAINLIKGVSRSPQLGHDMLHLATSITWISLS